MKYIRTKYGNIVDTSVYKKVVKRTFNGKVVGIDLNHWGQDSDKEITYIPVEDIVRQADKIKDLCDALVVKWNDGYALPIRNRALWPQYSRVGDTRYGAIWTDKGLIYVAKMNEKMELELL